MQPNCNYGPVIFVVLALLCPSWQAAEFELLAGHHEIQTDYDPNEGWRLAVSYNRNDDFNDRTQVRRLPADQTTLIAPPAARTTLPEGFEFLADGGETAWVLPQNFDEANHFLGMRVITDPGIFMTRVGNNFSNIGRGTISFSLLGATGSGPDRGGHFALWKSLPLGGSEVFVATRDGIDEGDEIPSLPAGAHSHFNWAFSKPGNYHLEFEVSGRLRSTQEEISHRQTFHFQVPHSGALEKIDASLCLLEGSWSLALRDSMNQVLYGRRRALVMVPAASDGVGYSCPARFDPLGSTFPDVAGLSLSLASSGASQALSGPIFLRLVQHVGPGAVSLDQRIQSADGLTEADQVDLGDPTEGQLTFTEAGIHTLTFQPIHSGSVEGPPMVIRCVAGIPFNYSFSEWADSYERAYGLPTGTLSSPEGDWNLDGRVHQLDFLLDAAGADPVRVRHRSHLLPRYDPLVRRFRFFRDLTKDPLDQAEPNLLIRFGSDLTSWTTLGPRNRGFPLEYGESGGERGNALSPFMQRTLRISPVPQKAFYQLVTE